MSAADFMQFDQAGIYYGQAYGETSKEDKKKIPANLYSSISNLHFEQEQNKNNSDPTNLLSGRPAINADDFLNYSSDIKVKGNDIDDKVLIHQLQKLGIDVFEFTDMSHNDRHLNIKVRDVI